MQSFLEQSGSMSCKVVLVLVFGFKELLLLSTLFWVHGCEEAAPTRAAKGIGDSPVFLSHPPGQKSVNFHRLGT